MFVSVASGVECLFMATFPRIGDVHGTSGYLPNGNMPVCFAPSARPHSNQDTTRSARRLTAWVSVRALDQEELGLGGAFTE